jgi:hypothetical protein
MGEKEGYWDGLAVSAILSRKPTDKKARVVAMTPPTYIGKRRL